MSATTADAIERERRDRIGIGLSLAIHFLFICFLVSIWPRPAAERDEAVERIVTITQRERPLTIEQRRKHEPAAPAINHEAAAASRPVAAVRVPHVPLNLTLPVPHLLERPSLPRIPHVVAYVPHHTTLPPAERPGQFSNAHIAQIDRDLGNAIAADRAAGRDVLAGTQSQPVYEKHYAPDVNSLTTGGVGSQGMCSPIKSWDSDGYTYYFVSCNVRFTDGTYEREDVPWPVRYRPSRDPFEGTASDGPLPLPLPGWSLPPGEVVAKGVRQYAIQHGYQFPE